MAWIESHQSIEKHPKVIQLGRSMEWSLCQPINTYDAHRCTCPDGPRYKALGNAVTVNVVEWIGQRIWHNRRR